MRYFTIALLMYAYCSYSQLDKVFFRQYGVKEGLSSNATTWFLKDSYGFVWIGTASGLNRFDGYQFKTWLHDPLDSTSLSNNRIFRLFEDSKKRLWVGTADGLDLFDRRTETFRRFNANMEDSLALRQGTILGIDEDQNGNLWIATFGGGLNKLDPTTEIFTSYLYSDEDSTSLRQNYVLSIYVDSDNIIWCGLAGWGLNRFDPSTGKFQHFVYDIGFTEYNVDNNAIQTIYEDRHGNLWIGSEGGLNLFNKEKSVYTDHFTHNPDDPTSLPSNFISRIHEREDGSFLIATQNGLAHFDPTAGESRNFYASPGRPGAIQDNNAYDFLFEKDGTVWLTTRLNGFSKGNLYSRPFTIEKHPNSKLIDLSTADVKNIAIDDQKRLLVSTRNGLAIISQDSDNIIELTSNPGSRVVLSGQSVLCTFQDSKGTYWIGTERNGLDRLDLRKRSVINYQHDPNRDGTLGFVNPASIVENTLGDMWVGIRGGGVSRMDKETGTFKTYLPVDGDETSIPDHRVTSMLIDSKSNFWVGTLSGLTRFDPENETFSRFQVSELNQPGVSNLEIQFIFEDSRENLWVGTRGGLDLISYDGIKLKNYTTKNGLASDQILSMLEEGDGIYWLGTDRGLSRFEYITGEFRNFDSSNGLPDKSFSANSSFKNNDGKLYFGNRAGLVSFHPEEVGFNDAIPPIVVTNFSVINELEDATSNFRSVVVDKEITLTHQQNVFSIEFAALSYVNPEKNQYAYMLEGFDKNWVQSGGRRSTFYTNLDAGDYVFRIKGTNNDGVWNEKGASLKITVLPPWWKTWWAYSIYLIFLVSLIWYLRRNLVRQERLNASLNLEKMEVEKMKELDALKTQFFTNVSHDLRTPLTLILGPLRDLITRNGKSGDSEMLKMMHRNGQTLLTLINQLLDVAKLRGGKLKLSASEGDLLKLCKQVFYSFESAAEQKEVAWEMESDDKLKKVYFDWDKMEKTLMNLLSNALKFTKPGGRVRLQLQEESNQASITISDTGVGIPEEELPRIFDRFFQGKENEGLEYPGTGIGLALVKDFVELHSGSISVDSTIAVGTTFKLSFPLGSEHFTEDEILKEPIEVVAQVDDKLIKESFEPSEPQEETDLPVILLVEDNLDMRTYLRSSLQDEYSLIETDNGKQGLELANDHVPDMIISDVMMPRMDGLEFCRRVKTDEKTSHIPVILLTARATQESRIEGLETGADAYLTKPFDSKELTVRIEKTIEQRQKLREKFSRQVTIGPAEVSVTSMDEQFLTNAIRIVEEHMSDAEFDVENFGAEIGLSRVQLYRKLKALTNLSVTEFVRNIRLKRAAQLIDQNSGTIAEITYKVGFTDASYFAKRFKETFGLTPTEYQERAQENQ